jgi:hypothetical protein
MAYALRCSMPERLGRNVAASNVGADLCVCPGPGVRLDAGADTQVCPYVG